MAHHKRKRTKEVTIVDCCWAERYRMKTTNMALRRPHRDRKQPQFYDSEDCRPYSERGPVSEYAGI